MIKLDEEMKKKNIKR